MVNNSSFHNSFATALLNTATDSAPLLRSIEHGAHRRRFDVYRNNRAVSLIEALRATYPVVYKLVGDEFFKASARAFIDVNPPTQPVMAEYGREFGGFISALPNADKLPFLNDVAELEWWRLQAYHCVDASVLQPSALAGVAPHSVMDIRLQCHPALRCVVSRWPVGSIWTSCIEDSNGTSTVNSRVDMHKSEAIVITRPEIQVWTNVVNEAGVVFLNAIQNGETLGAAAEQGLERDIGFNAGEHLTGLITLGAFTGFNETEEQI